MRDDAKARAAGSTERTGAGRKPALLLVVLAASVAALALVVGSASGATTRFLVEAFGSAEQPTFPADRGMAYDQGSEELYVIDSTSDTLSRFNADGTASDFGALGSNAIDGEGAGDETAHGHLAFESNRQREQVAIDESGEATDGNVYITQSSLDVVDIFSSEGEYLGQLSESTGTGAFGEPCGVAVDAAGTVYVGDRGDDRIHVFDPAANPPVNADNTASFETVTDPCTLAAGTGATEGFLFVNTSFGAALSKVDAATGEVKYQLATGGSTVSVDPATGHVFAARNTFSSSSVDEYDASGATEATLVSSFKPGSTVEGVAVNSANEEVYVARSGTENVEVFGPPAIVPDVVTEAPSSNTGTRATLAGTVNPDGVELDECFFEWTQAAFTPSSYDNVIPCAQTPAEIGAGTTPVPVEAELTGLVPQGTRYHYRLVAVNPNGTVNGSNQAFETPDTVVTQAASGVTDTEATLNGTVNPDTEPISECLFEWGPEKGPFDNVQEFPETAPCVPGPGGIGTGEAPVAVEADISGLHPGTAYAYRLKAAYPTGPITGDTETVQTLGPRIADSWAEDVLHTEAILKAEIDPEGTATTYHFEWGPTTAYGSETEELNVGSDSSLHTLSRFLDDLTPGTTYHWRVVATSAAGENEGPDHVIRTFRRFKAETDCPNQVNRYGAGANLPDCRAYEMVSPLDKNNGDIRSLLTSESNAPARMNQSTPSGERITYSAATAFADAQSVPYASQYIAERRSGGWQTHAINPPAENVIVSGISAAFEQYQGFSEDLCYGWMRNQAEPPLSPAALPEVSNLYRRTDRLCGNEHFEAVAPVAPALGDGALFALFQGASADGSHAIFRVGSSFGQQLYESTKPEAGPRLVCILPNGEPLAGPCRAGSGIATKRRANIQGAISDDGGSIFWSPGSSAAESRLYVRIGGTETLTVSETAEAEAGTSGSHFWGAAADGSRAVFTTGNLAPGVSNSARLYSYEPESEATELIAEKANGVMGISDDARRIYFASSKALAGAAVDGQINAYLYDADAGTTTFIATLANQDYDSGGQARSPIKSFPLRRAARVSPDGLHVAFSSHASLTGHDNHGSWEAYVYDAGSKELDCASCNPSGARAEGNGLVPDFETSHYAKRSLSDDGSRLFFESTDGVLPRDSNGKNDVYQWEELGAGECDAADSDFAPSASGCISLITSGTSPIDAEFVDASASGDDVFVNTGSSLVSQDYGLLDIYDARVGGGSPPPPEPPDCFGDACQGIPNQPDDPTPASAGFRGAGDPTPRRNCGAPAKRAAKHSRRAKRLRRAAKRSSNQRRSKRMRRKSVRFAKNAKRLSRNAKRCRRASRRAGR